MPRQLYTLNHKGGVQPATEAEIISAAQSIYGSKGRGKPRRLTPKVVAQIKRWRAQRWTWNKIAAEAKVSRQSILAARKRNGW